MVTYININHVPGTIQLLKIAFENKNFNYFVIWDYNEVNELAKKILRLYTKSVQKLKMFDFEKYYKKIMRKIKGM